jgi:hypothetical protein
MSMAIRGMDRKDRNQVAHPGADRMGALSRMGSWYLDRSTYLG